MIWKLALAEHRSRVKTGMEGSVVKTKNKTGKDNGFTRWPCESWDEMEML